MSPDRDVRLGGEEPDLDPYDDEAPRSIFSAAVVSRASGRPGPRCPRRRRRAVRARLRDDACAETQAPDRHAGPHVAGPGSCAVPRRGARHVSGHRRSRLDPARDRDTRSGQARDTAARGGKGASGRRQGGRGAEVGPESSRREARARQGGRPERRWRTVLGAGRRVQGRRDGHADGRAAARAGACRERVDDQRLPRPGPWRRRRRRRARRAIATTCSCRAAPAVDIDAKLTPKGFTAQSAANGVLVRPSLALRDAVALSRELVGRRSQRAGAPRVRAGVAAASRGGDPGGSGHGRCGDAAPRARRRLRRPRHGGGGDEAARGEGVQALHRARRVMTIVSGGGEPTP